MSAFVRALDDPVTVDPAVAGGKGATLARLFALDLPVPDGVVVTTAAYRALVDDPTIGALLADIDSAVTADRIGDAVEIARQVREAIVGRPLPEGVSDAFDRTLPPGPYAVRSSATSEDQPDASFAGQHDTSLGVERDALDASVRDCMASLFTDRAVRYRAERGVPATTVEMAVVVQRLVEPDTSGILFSADPITGDRTMAVLDAGPGRGERQVSGRSTADTVRFDRDAGEVVEYRIGGERSERVLAARDVRALVTIGARVADALGGPQDIEWAIADGAISVLQARPITALFPVPEPTPTDDRTHVYYSFGHRQGMTDAMPPLVVDVWRDVIREVGRNLGLWKRVAAVAGGRLYIDLTAYLEHPRLRDRLLSNFQVVDEPAAAALETLLSDERDFPVSDPSVWRSLRTLRSLARVSPAVGGVVGSLSAALVAADPEAEPRRLRETYETASEAALSRIRSADGPAARIDAAYRELLAAPDWLLDAFYGPFLAGLAAGAVMRRLLPDHADRIDALALGITDDPVFGMTMALGDLADVARDTPVVADAIGAGASRDEVVTLDGSEPFLAALDSFLEEYGFRAIGEIDFARPRYHEDPAPLLNVVAGTLETSDAGAHRALATDLEGRAQTAADTLVGAASPPLRPLVRRLARVARGYIGLREHPKFALARLFAELRAQILAGGERLAGAGALPDAADVWLLTRAELTTALDDPRTLAGIDLAGRRQTFERDQQRTAPRIITSDGEIPHARTGARDTAATDATLVGARDTAATDATLVGTGAAPGVAEGTVQVVTDPATERFERGAVLVAAYTDPGWTPLFPTAAAVVTEVGGRLTHGSLVAREYGIPAVVAVGDATTRLRTGERVRVDGTRGLVERLTGEGESTEPPRRDRPVPEDR